MKRRNICRGNHHANDLYNMSKKEIDPKIVQEIIDSVQQIEYGEISIIVHDSEVVQIEKKSKKRFKKK